MSHVRLSDRLDSAVSSLVEQTVGGKRAWLDVVRSVQETIAKNDTQNDVFNEQNYRVSFNVQWSHVDIVLDTKGKNPTCTTFKYDRSNFYLHRVIFESNKNIKVDYMRGATYNSFFNDNTFFLYSLTGAFESPIHQHFSESIGECRPFDHQTTSHETHENNTLIDSHYGKTPTKPLSTRIGDFLCWGWNVNPRAIKPKIRRPIPFNVRDLSLSKTRSI